MTAKSLRLIAVVLLSLAPATVVAIDAGPANDGPTMSENEGDGPTVSVRERARRKRASKLAEAARKGEAELRKSVRVFQQRYLLKGGRVEILAGGGSVFGDPLTHHCAADAGLLYHVNEEWSVGIDGVKYFGERKESFLNVQSDFGLFPERSLLQASVFAQTQYSPIFGKFASFALAVIQVDSYLIAGLGGVRTTLGDAIKPAALVGFGTRLHILRWLTLSFEVRDALMMETFRDDNQVLLQHLSAGVRLGFWVPPTFQYRYQR